MSQSRKQSLFESCANIAIGYFLALATQLLLFPALGIPVRLSQNVAIRGGVYGGVAGAELRAAAGV